MGHTTFITPRRNLISAFFQTMDEVKKKLDELVKNSDLFVASPETLERMKQRGLPIKSTFQTYTEYLDNLFKKRRDQAEILIKDLPLLDESIANATVSSLYEEFKECFVMGINGASIILAILLLDLSAKYKLFELRKEKNPRSSWKPIEELMLKEVIEELGQYKAISEEEEKSLLSFNSKIRNNYLHYNIQKLVKDVIASKLPSVDVVTGEIVIENDVRAAERPHLWFFAKKILDKESIVDRTSFCIGWTNKLLKKSKS